MSTVVPDLHRLPMRDFEALARGDGDARTVRQLLAAERSRRLLLLRVLDDELAARPGATGPLPPADTAWDLLAEAQRQDLTAFDDVLMHPQTGLWLAHALRRLRGRTPGEDPLWTVLGHLHAVAAAAGIRAGLEFGIELAVRGGHVVLPALGCAVLGGTDPWSVAELTAGGGRVRLRTAGVGAAGLEVVLPARPAEDGPGWYGLRRLTVGAPGEGLSVRLDDLDPYRSMQQPAGPQRLSAASAERWCSLLEAAWQVLRRAEPETASAMRAGLLSISPVPAAERYRPRSASAGDAFGGLLASEPDDPVQLAGTLVHEFQHIKLGALVHLAPLLLDEAGGPEPDELFYAPWRDDPRPPGGLLQGVYAFLGVTRFWRAYRLTDGPEAGLAHFEFALWRRQVWRTLRLLQRQDGLTPLGRTFLDGLRQRCAPWLEEPVPAAPLRLAEQAMADHRARWRIHHLSPDPQSVSAAAGAWTRGAAHPPAGATAAPSVRADPSARRLDTRAALARLRLGDPAAFARLRDLPAQSLAARVAGATAGDLALAAGDPAGARGLFLAHLAADPDSPSGWTGLGQALTAGPAPQPAASAGAAAILRDRPETVRAVQRALLESGEGAADPIELAGWLGGAGRRPC